MTRYYIDTNCLISYVTDRNIEQQEKIAPFFDNAAVLKHQLIVIEHIITEFIYVCISVYRLVPVKVREMILALLHTPGIQLESGYSPAAVFHLWPDYVDTYADAVLAAAAQVQKGTLLTFDKNLRKKCSALQIDTAEGL